MNEIEEKAIIETMVRDGWTCNVNTSERLGFILYQDEEHEWIRDYNKKTRRFVQFNGREKITIEVIE